MTNGTSLTCCTTTVYIYKNIKFVSCLCSYERLTNDQFQCLKTEILIDASFINNDVACTWNQIYSSN